MTLLTVMKGIPLAYDKDIQEDKEAAFDAIDTVCGCIRLMAGMLGTCKFNIAVMKQSAMKGFTNATDVADYLVSRGVPFRDAHTYVGKIVLYCIEHDLSIEEMSMDEFKAICPEFREDVYEAISLQACVERRRTKGAPGIDPIKEEIREAEIYLQNLL